MERKWVIGAFLDVSDFRIWIYRASIAPEVKVQFLNAFYGGLQAYVDRYRDRWSKYEGDGLITVREFTPIERKDPAVISDFLLSLRGLLRKSEQVIRECEAPPPGVRIRIMDGYVYKLLVVDPNDPKRIRLIAEYVDYCLNTLRGLLGVNPEIPAMATKGVVKLLGRKRSLFGVRPLRKPSCFPKGVNREDVEDLQILKF